MISFAYNQSLSNERISFIKQTYQLLALSLLTAALGCFLGLDNLKIVVSYFWGFVILEFAILFALFFCKDRSSLNYLLLFAFTFLTGLTTVPLIAKTLTIAGGANIVANAFILSSVAFGALSIYAMRTKKDFTLYGQILFISLIVLIVAGLLNLFFHSPVMQLALAVITVILFSIFIIFDTQNIIKGNIDSPVIAAIQLYLDFLNIFIALIRILTGSKD